MKGYKLKPGQPGFAIVDGPYRGKRFEPGKHYSGDEIPADRMNRFVPADTPANDAAGPVSINDPGDEGDY